MGGLLRLKLENDVLDIVEVKSAVLEDRRASFVRRFSAVYGPPSVCARTDLCQGLSVVRYVKDRWEGCMQGSVSIIMSRQ